MAQEFVRRVVLDHLSAPFDDEEMTERSDESLGDIFACLTRLQLESLIEQLAEDAPLTERLAVATRILIAGKRDAFKKRHNLSIPLPRHQNLRQLPIGQLAVMSRVELEDFAKTS